MHIELRVIGNYSSLIDLLPTIIGLNWNPQTTNSSQQRLFAYYWLKHIRTIIAYMVLYGRRYVLRAFLDIQELSFNIISFMLNDKN